MENTLIEQTENKITIDGKSYTIKKLKFGKQIELAKIIINALKGMQMGANTKNSKDNKISLDFQTLLSASIENLASIVSIGLDISKEEVENFEDTEAVLKALEQIMSLNPINDILGKSSALLNGIM